MWREEVTDKSWRLLRRLNSEFRFTLIGGWAVYLYTHGPKSKDIDIIVDLDVLQELKARYDILKNLRLRKYEFVVDGIDVDTYAPFYSDLGIPAEEVQANTTHVEGFVVPRPEYLLATKQRAELARRASDKGYKDRVDILSLLLNAGVDLTGYASLLSKHSLGGYLRELRNMISQDVAEFSELGVRDPGKVRKLKKQLLSRIDEATRRRSR